MDTDTDTDTALRPDLVDQVERGLRRSPEAGEPGVRGHLSDGGLARLRPERVPAGLGEPVRYGEERREAVVDPPDGVEVVLHPVARGRLDDHPGPVGGQRLADVAGRTERVAHVVQAVEGRHQVVAATGERLRGGDLE